MSFFRKHLISCLTFAVSLPFFLMLFVAFLLPSQYHDTYLGEMPHKLHRLTSTEGKRIVVIGGSCVPFALRSDLLEEAFPEYQVVDFGLYGDIGTLPMLDLALPLLREGDIVLLMPELNEQSLSEYVGGEQLLQAFDGMPLNLFRLSFEKYEPLIAALPTFAGKKLSYTLLGSPIPEGLYQRSSFNAYGDIDSPLRAGNIMTAGFQPNNDLCLEVSRISPAFLEGVHRFAEDATAKEVHVLWHFSPINQKALTQKYQAQQLDLFCESLSAQLPFPILGNPHQAVLDAIWFYDTNFHLNAEGAITFTHLLAQELRVYFQDPTPIPFTTGQRPIVNNSPFIGDNSDDDKFVYQQASNGYRLIGLTAQGQTADTLILPTTCNGLPVTEIDQRLFSNCSQLRQVTIQPNLNSLPDHLFDGCPQLERLIIAAQNPSAITPGDDLMDNHTFLIVVPTDTADVFRRGYSWHKYAPYIVEAP